MIQLCTIELKHRCGGSYAAVAVKQRNWYRAKSVVGVVKAVEKQMQVYIRWKVLAGSQGCLSWIWKQASKLVSVGNKQGECMHI